MKTFFAKSGRLIGLTIAALAALAAPVSNALSQPASPVGLWDCIMSGSGQDGILFLNFTTDTDTPNGLPIFEGIFVQAGQTKVPTGRAGSTANTRSGSSGGTLTNLFGGGFINGSASGTNASIGSDDWLPDSRGHRGYWAYNSKAQTVGSFYTVLTTTAIVTNYFDWCTNITVGGITYDFCFTNAALVVTNIPGVQNLSLPNPNFTVGFLGVTNDVSFIGKVVPGKRLTLVGTSIFGKFTIRGVPLVPLSTALPIDGFPWTGVKTENGFKSVEEFNLTSMGIFNAYGMTGQGPSYTYGVTNTVCLVSSQKRIGFSVDEIPFGTSPLFPEIRATIGKLTNTKKAFGTKGVGDSTGDPLNLIKFNASLVPYIIP